MEKVLIVSVDRYPNGNAGAVRQHTLAKLFESCGYCPVVIGMGESTDYKYKEYDGIQYISFRARSTNILKRIANLILFKAKLNKFLKKNMEFKKIILSEIPPNALFYLKKYSKEKAVQLIYDSVEWYSPEEFSLNRYAPSYRINDRYNTRWIDNNFKVIAISKFLESNYLSRGIMTIRIPAVMDVNNMPYKKRTDINKLVIVYAGTMGKKDYLKEIVESLKFLKENEISKVEFRIFGVSWEQLIPDIDFSDEFINKVGTSLKCFGRVPRQTVLNNLEEADFTALLRLPTQRYAQAGFPTKVVESLARATPVICNLTSDLKDYISDGVNGFIVEGCTAEAFANTLKKALKITFEQRKIMYENARKTAENNFNYRMYSDKIEKLLDK